MKKKLIKNLAFTITAIGLTLLVFLVFLIFAPNGQDLISPYGDEVLMEVLGNLIFFSGLGDVIRYSLKK